MRHYTRFADHIIVIDKHSSDRTHEIVAQYGAELVLWSTNNGELDDFENMAIKNTYYQGLTNDYDWFIVVDSDELLSDGVDTY
jgi:glycosyltransferase involved in cell wall biosynthesis